MKDDHKEIIGSLIVFFIIIAILIFFIIMLKNIGNEIQEIGLKNIINEIWEGSNE